ncbi:RNA polymerase-binding protein RbpA [Streptacidiphilus jiangxiensis]|uniref:RNA polymerase-binding protein RbpA n=1 Tax=Streptacidiphilus jiangxiensis TaxID=235985 RepID=A0A1H8BCU3_STRJI|nr:RNA polymerase-binding protein RbpA [Streptacidiphilus jiangxiensis]SEM80269.1 RNA polymerase-binding protein [Streptacidiphilus jiangxiensis]
MAQGRSSIRGARIGSGPLGEPERGDLAPRTTASFWCGNGHRTQPSFAVEAVIPEVWDCPRCGLPAGPDPDNAPAAPGSARYLTHMGFVRQRRSQEEGEALLNEALAKLRGTI